MFLQWLEIKLYILNQIISLIKSQITIRNSKIEIKTTKVAFYYYHNALKQSSGEPQLQVKTLMMNIIKKWLDGTYFMI